jgi:hypothetical protein
MVTESSQLARNTPITTKPNVLKLPLRASTAFQNAPSGWSLFPINPRASTPPITTATRTETRIIVRL